MSYRSAQPLSPSGEAVPCPSCGEEAELLAAPFYAHALGPRRSLNQPSRRPGRGCKPGV